MNVFHCVMTHVKHVSEKCCKGSRFWRNRENSATCTGSGTVAGSVTVAHKK